MIHVLTLSWNGLDKLKRLKNGLFKNLDKTNQDYIWYIRSNGCQDGTVEEISTWNKVEVLSINHNRDNFAQGINSLAWKAYGHDMSFMSEGKVLLKGRTIGPSKNIDDNDIFLILNNDVIFQDDESLSKMISLLTEDVGIVGARLLYNETNKLQHAGVIFSKKYNFMPYHYRHGEESDLAAETNRYFQAVTAAVCIVRVKDFINLGGLDTSFHWAFEDIDFNLRLGHLGKKNVYCGSTKIFHEESASLKKNPVNKLYINTNVTRFKQKWQGKYLIDHEKYLTNIHYNEVK